MRSKIRQVSRAISALCCALVLCNFPASAEDPGYESAAAPAGDVLLDDAALESASRRLMEAEAALEKEISAKKPSSATTVVREKLPAPAPEKSASEREASSVKPPAAQPALSRISKEIAGEMDNLHTKNTTLKKEVGSQSRSILSLNANNSSLKGRLAASEQRAEVLLAKMKEMRNQLLMAETEISRLSSIIEDRNRTTLARFSGKMNAASPLKAAVPAKPTLLTKVQEEKASEDMPVATVMVENAQLRSGPGKNNSPLMAVSKGTRLAVEARLGEWYRVIAPTGARAWIDAGIVAFAKDSQSAPTRTVKIQGYDPSIEKQAFEFIRSDMQR